VCKGEVHSQRAAKTKGILRVPPGGKKEMGKVWKVQAVLGGARGGRVVGNGVARTGKSRACSFLGGKE